MLDVLDVLDAVPRKVIERFVAVMCAQGARVVAQQHGVIALVCIALRAAVWFFALARPVAADVEPVHVYINKPLITLTAKKSNQRAPVGGGAW